jgi:hypothetical protein
MGKWTGREQDSFARTSTAREKVSELAGRCGAEAVTQFRLEVHFQ